MLDIKYLRVGTSIELPELAGYVPEGPTSFSVEGTFPGGMGLCVRLRQLTTGAEFALKGVRPDLVAEEATTDRFLDELKVWLSASSNSLVAEALAVVRINEMPCVLATWMPNGDLAHALSRLTPTSKIESLVRMVRGLAWVKNNLGIMHRDLKPANILLDADDLAYIADWGLARPIGHALKEIGIAVAAGSVERPDRTQKGSFLGTVSYAAPEQILGSESVDHRADIYSLGCMMFEYETGATPFKGETINEIARKHLREKPRKLGGWLTSTELGLERIIARCLEKIPDARYPSYEALESDLLSVSRCHHVDLSRCVAKTRYQRTVLGKGGQQQEALLLYGTEVIRGKDGWVLVDPAILQRFIVEAQNLMALGRYAETERLLRPHIIRDALNVGEWSSSHSLTVNYATCLFKIGRTLDAEALFVSLEQVEPKPAEFFINYSLTLLGLRKGRQAANLCRTGLERYAGDLDIQGNLTIALTGLGEYEQAFASAVKRLSLRRDVHSLGEAAAVLLGHAKAIRGTDLPKAIELAKMMGSLVREGLAINPNYYTLRLLEISLRRFAYDEHLVAKLAAAIYESDSCPSVFRRRAFLEMVEDFAEGKNFETALSLIQKTLSSSQHRQMKDIDEANLSAIRLAIYARHKMIGKELNDGRRIVIPEVVEYFLKPDSSGCYPDPVLAAELQDWLGDPDKALTTLANRLEKEPADWDGIKLVAMLHWRGGRNPQALKFAQLLVTTAPWKAESYDLLAFIAEKTGQSDLLAFAKARGDQVFTDETRLYDDLRSTLDQ